jgi:pantoate--beta-alanine ligase
MGALHEGHLSLIRKSSAECDFTVTSVFVNPKQFGAGEDLGRYPRNLERDAGLAAGAGNRLLFAPEAGTVYPDGFRTAVSVAGLKDRLCGAFRPGHFDGVLTVVLKLLHLVEPHDLYMGQKDAQQALLVRRMIRDLDCDVRLHVCRTVREPDGLALSSRNAYLTPEERAWAPAIFRSLASALRLVQNGERESAVVEAAVRRGLEGGPGRTEYVAIVDTEALDPTPHIQGDVLIAVAVRLGAARLIDNVIVTAGAGPAGAGEGGVP